MGMEDDDDIRKANSDEEAVDDPNPVANDTMGEFDRLLAEQVSYYQNNSMAAPSPRTPAGPPPRMQAVSSTPVPVSTHSCVCEHEVPCNVSIIRTIFDFWYMATQTHALVRKIKITSVLHGNFASLFN